MELMVGTREPPKEKTSNKGMSGFMQEERFNCIKIDQMFVGWREVEKETSDERNNNNNSRVGQETNGVRVTPEPKEKKSLPGAHG